MSTHQSFITELEKNGFKCREKLFPQTTYQSIENPVIECVFKPSPNLTPQTQFTIVFENVSKKLRVYINNPSFSFNCLAPPQASVYFPRNAKIEYFHSFHGNAPRNDETYEMKQGTIPKLIIEPKQNIINVYSGGKIK